MDEAMVSKGDVIPFTLCSCYLCTYLSCGWAYNFR